MAKKRRAIPNFFTIGNFIGGLLAIQFSLTGKIEWAPYCIFIALIFDFLDGFMAGLLNAKSDKGKQMDSLADIVTFGVAPGFIMFNLMSLNEIYLGGSRMPPSESFAELIDSFPVEIYEIPSVFAYIAFIMPVFALFRLAKYNVDTEQSDSFLGVPTATMAIFFAAFPILIHDTLMNPSAFKNYIVNTFLINPWALAVLTIVFSILMVTRIPLIALKFKTFKWPGNQFRFIFLVLALVSIIVFKFWSVPLIVILYILLSLINNLITNSTAKK